jgi:CBS domain-containing protein
MIMRVKKLLNSIGNDVDTISPDARVYDAMELMRKKEISAIVVVEKDKMVGIVSEQDYKRKIILKGKNPRETLVREIMTPDVIHTSPDKKLGKCLSLMMKKRIHQLPVLEKERLVGMVTTEDIRWSWLPSKISKEKYNCGL